VLTFKAEMDAHSLTLERDGKRIGFLHWHEGRSPRVVLWAGPGGSNELTIEEMEQVTRRYHADRAERTAAGVAVGMRFLVGVSVYVVQHRVGTGRYWSAKSEKTESVVEVPADYIRANLFTEGSDG
jgi:hypothetical protein